MGKAEKDKTVRLQTRVPEDLARRARATAAMRGMGMEAWLRLLVEANASEFDQKS